jgi:ParB-like chromosome segregation protein Spo0J
MILPPNERRSSAAPTPARKVPLESLRLPFSRKVPNARKFTQLKESMAANGLLEPIHIAPDKDVVSGNCRVICARELGWDEIDAFEHPELTAFEDKLHYAFTADVKSDRDPTERGFMLRDWMQRTGKRQNDAAKVFGISEPQVSRFLSLTEMLPEILDAIRAERICVAHAIVLKKAPSDARRLEVLKEAIEHKLTPADLVARIKRKLPPKRKCILLPVGGTRIEIPVDHSPAELIESFKSVLFPACNRASSMNLGVDALAKIIASAKG